MQEEASEQNLQTTKQRTETIKYSPKAIILNTYPPKEKFDMVYAPTPVEHDIPVVKEAIKHKLTIKLKPRHITLFNQDILKVSTLDFEEWFKQMSVDCLEKVEEIYISNSANPTGKLATVLRPYLALHPLHIQLQDSQINY